MTVSIGRRGVAMAPASGTCKLCHTVERMLAVANHSLTKPEWVV